MWGLLFLLSFVAVTIVSILGGDGMSENQAALNDMPLLYVVPLACIWAPIVEEGIFRGVLRRFIPNNDKLFIAVSAITFGLLHTVGQEVGIFNTILYALQYMAMGGALAYTYVNSNNITDKGILITKENNLVFSNNERKIVVTENNLIIDEPLQSIEMDEEVLEH